jgi:hypothetical protein
MQEYQTGILAEYVPYTPLTSQNLRKLAELKPQTLAILHGSSFRAKAREPCRTWMRRSEKCLAATARRSKYKRSATASFRLGATHTPTLTNAAAIKKNATSGPCQRFRDNLIQQFTVATPRCE